MVRRAEWWQKRAMTGQATGGTDLRALKALVGVMGVLIVVGTALVIGVIIHRLYARTADSSIIGSREPTSPMVNIPAAGQGVTLAAGDHVAGIATAGDDLAVWVTGAGGDRILLISPKTGARTVILTAPK